MGKKQGPRGRRALGRRDAKARLQAQADGAASNLVEKVQRQFNDLLVLDRFDRVFR
jgi:hypothetical protein